MPIPTVSRGFDRVLMEFRLCFGTFRYMNALYRLANKHPFWGAKRLSDTLHEEMMAALISRPPGAVIQVFCHSGDKKQHACCI